MPSGRRNAPRYWRFDEYKSGSVVGLGGVAAFVAALAVNARARRQDSVRVWNELMNVSQGELAGRSVRGQYRVSRDYDAKISRITDFRVVNQFAILRLILDMYAVSRKLPLAWNGSRL